MPVETGQQKLTRMGSLLNHAAQREDEDGEERVPAL